ncbi:DNA-binding protein [Streptomyces sp. 110]|uniref:DNA-binding protein n=1 Tax=Streptomyces endocoffeicus TaxID=2898945 RepID=A0ABS1Q782_9ACTN|nr:DNA-binding protein [Streptomyces endocoffeicus]MBL1120527.1 DNA-binding protein [Streptomyces endocoffeicus]
MANESAGKRHLSEQVADSGITRQEYAALARVHLDTVKRWARLGIGPRPRRVGPRLVRYDRAEVLEFLGIGEQRGPVS